MWGDFCDVYSPSKEEAKKLDIFDVLNDNLNKFTYKRHCGCVSWFEYKDIKIEITCDFFCLFNIYNLYYKNCKLVLNRNEYRKLKRVVKSLLELKNENMKKEAISQIKN